MANPPVPNTEVERLQALRSYRILDTEAEEAFDELTQLAAYICEAPIALISLVDQHRQWFKSKIGIDATETPRELAFCAHAICQPDDLFVVPNALDDSRFSTNPLVTADPEIRFYAGKPLVTSEGHALGTLCVIDRVPRTLSPEQLQALHALGRQVIDQLDLRLQLRSLKHAQVQLVHYENMSSLGEFVAGVAHEINNPVTFIHGNLRHLDDYTWTFLNIIEKYQQYFPDPPAPLQRLIEESDLSFITQDIQKLLQSTYSGTSRIKTIVQSLRNFSRHDEAELKKVDIHQGIESTLLMLQHRLTAKGCNKISILRSYGELPEIECYPSHLNQVVMHIIANGIDALEHYPRPGKCIQIRTQAIEPGWIEIQIIDNGPGIPEKLQTKIFDPFFTTKSMGKGNGLGLSISYQIITQKHGGSIHYESATDGGAKFSIWLPIKTQTSCFLEPETARNLREVAI